MVLPELNVNPYGFRASSAAPEINENHYENLPMQYAEIFLVVKNENFHCKILIFFL